MRTSFARLTSTALVVWLAVWMVLDVNRATAQQDESAAVERVVIDLVRAEQNGDLHLLYDYMEPEAREMVPRQAFMNWRTEEDFAVPTGTPEIDSITFEDAEYELTGTEFENMAFVEFTVPVDGDEESRELRLVNDGVTWRWLLDLPEDDVEDIAENAEFTVEYESLYQTDIYHQLDMFWAQVFADHGAPYRSPIDLVGVYQFPLETACGESTQEEFSNNAMYCGYDETIYYDPYFRDQIIEAFGEFAWHHVIAHEWGHHIENLLGLFASVDPELYGGNYTIEHELLADCLAAIFSQDVRARGQMGNRDVNGIEEITGSIGDPEGLTWDTPGAHGSGEQRVESFWLGYEDGFRGCYVDFDSIAE